MPIRPIEIMEKHTYDPDKDGLIALAQLVAAVCSETEADNKITAHTTPSAHHAKTTSASELTSGVLPSIDRLPALTTGKIWKGNANRPAEADPPGIPSGVIAIWHGLIANIPSGYVICDGNNSTPNLLARFVQGVATALTDPSATGGEATHTLSTAELPAHTHTEGMHDQGETSDHMKQYLVGAKEQTQDWAHAGGSAGSNSAHENKPPFYDVAFIMKT